MLNKENAAAQADRTRELAEIADAATSSHALIIP